MKIPEIPIDPNTQQTVDLGLFVDDEDEFDLCAEEEDSGPEDEQENEDESLWERWDDDVEDEDFTKKLKEQIEKLKERVAE